MFPPPLFSVWAAIVLPVSAAIAVGTALSGPGRMSLGEKLYEIKAAAVMEIRRCWRR